MASGFGGFGNSTSQPQTSSLFGSNNQSNTGFGNTGGFGSNNTNSGNNSGFGAGGFGQNNTNTTGFGSFGQNNTNTSGFGQTSNTGSFGSTGMSQNNNASTGAFGSTFGSNTNTSGSGGFGQTATNTGGAFGSSNTGGFGTSTFGSNTNQSNTGFGTSGTAQTNTNSGGFGSTFGQTSSNTGGFGSTFGQNNTGSNSGGFGSFGQSNTGGGTGGFGSSFGQGNTGGNTGGFGSFGKTTFGTPSSQPGSSWTGGSTFGTNPQAASTQPPQSQAMSFWDQLLLLKEHWNPQSNHCKFQHIFYNIVHPSEVPLYGKPPNLDDSMWKLAQEENPDPSCLVPVVATGFEDVKKRVDQQIAQTNVHQENLNDIYERIKRIEESHSVNTLTKVKELRRQYLNLQHRVLRFLIKVHVACNSNSPIKPEEEIVRVRLENIQNIILRPELKNRIHELSSQLQTLENIKKSQSYATYNSIEYQFVNEEQLKDIMNILKQEQKGISHLIKVIKNDDKELHAISNLQQSQP